MTQLTKIIQIGLSSNQSTPYPPWQYPESLRQPQTPPRHFPDTLQTPQDIEYLVQSEVTGRKRNKLIEISLTGWLSIAFTSYPPESIRSHSDSTKAPLRNLPHTFQKPQNIAHFDQSEATEKKRNKLMKMSLLGCLFVSCTSYPPESIQSHSDNPRHPPDTFQTPSRHPKIYHISTNPRQLGEKE